MGCGLPQRTRFTRTFADRAVFFPTYTPPEKMIDIYFSPAGAKLCEAFWLTQPTKRCRFDGCAVFCHTHRRAGTNRMLW